MNGSRHTGTSTGRPPQAPIAPERLWLLSSRLHSAGHRRTARLIKLIVYVTFRAILPPQASLGRDVRLGHLGLGVVVHPNVSIGDRVWIWHGVTIAAQGRVGGLARVVIENDVEVGAGALILSPRDGELVIGAGAKIGAHAIVTHSVAAGARVIGVAAQVVSTTEKGEH